MHLQSEHRRVELFTQIYHGQHARPIDHKLLSQLNFDDCYIFCNHKLNGLTHKQLCNGGQKSQFRGSAQHNETQKS